MVASDVDEEIKAHTNESLVLLLAIGPRSCSFQKLKCKVQLEPLNSLISCIK